MLKKSTKEDTWSGISEKVKVALEKFVRDIRSSIVNVEQMISETYMYCREIKF